MSTEDLFGLFDRLVKEELGPWLRAQGFSGRGTKFTRILSKERVLLLGIKRSKSNRRDAPQFDYIVNAYIMEAETKRLVWFWDVIFHGFGDPPRAEGPSGWLQLDATSDIAAIAREIEQALEESLIPAALQEDRDPSGQSLSGSRVGGGYPPKS